MTHPALFVGDGKCDMVMVDFVETSRLEWLSCPVGTRDRFELFIVLKPGTALNTIASQVMAQNIYGDVYFVKLVRDKWAIIEYSDVPGLLDIIMATMTMEDSGMDLDPPQSNVMSHHDQTSEWADGWNDGWRTPSDCGYDSL
jgi:hypothetical protein